MQARREGDALAIDLRSGRTRRRRSPGIDPSWEA